MTTKTSPKKAHTNGSGDSKAKRPAMDLAFFTAGIVAASLVLVPILFSSKEKEPTEVTAKAQKTLIDTSLPVEEISVPVFGSVEIPIERKEVFDAGVEGMVGWHVSIKGSDSIIYTTEDGEHAFLGMVVNQKGENLTEKHALAKIGGMDVQGDTAKLPGTGSPAASDKAAPQKTGIDPEEAWKAVTQTPFAYTEGNGPQEIYVTFDPRCPYCHDYSKKLAGLHDKLTIHWIPIAVLGPDSDKQARMLADSSSPLELHKEIMAGGAVQAPDQPSEEAIETIMGNTRIAFSAGLRMTPVTVAKTQEGPIAIPGSLDPAQLLAKFR